MAFDIHPWSGFLNLALHHDADPVPIRGQYGIPVADWEYGYHRVAERYGQSTWPEIEPIAAAIERDYPSIEEDQERVAQLFRSFIESCNEAVFLETVTEVLSTSKNFFVLTQNPDDQKSLFGFRYDRQVTHPLTSHEPPPIQYHF